MKYGDALRQHSVPEWAYYNVDYEAVKHLIKECTSTGKGAGKGKALDIPGQGDDALVDSELRLYNVLVSEHDRVGLFVKSKLNEIRGRLSGIEKTLEKLQARSKLSAEGPRPYMLQRYGRLEQDATSAGDEIRSLSRFIVAQKTAFRKLLKKYKKWSRSTTFDEKFRSKTLDRASSFAKISLGDVFDRWTSLLQKIRATRTTKSQAKTQHDLPAPPMRSKVKVKIQESSSSIAEQFESALGSASDVNFDTVFSETPTGELGSRAVYWVHHEQLIELQVLLLQHLRLYLAKPILGGGTSSSLSQSPVVTRRSSLSTRQEGFIERENESGVIYLDDVDEYAERLSRATVYDSEGHGFEEPFTHASAAARWCFGMDDSTLAFRRNKNLSKPRLARVRRKHLGALLDAERDFKPWQSVGTPLDETFSTSLLGNMSADEARDLLEKRKELQPLVAIFSKRTRFMGLGNTSSAGQWAVLDAQIAISKVMREDLAGKDWIANLNRDAKEFPFAVLRVRQEGKFAKNIIDILDKSHLTERVRGFSLESHAIWECWKPHRMSPPFWLAALSKDIRKVPEVVTLDRRSSIQVAAARKAEDSSTSSTSSNGGWGSSTAVAGESSATSVPTTPNLEPRDILAIVRPAREKKTVTYADTIADKPLRKKTKEEPRYWNEYDFPESDDDQGAYYIYIDPEKEEKWLSKDTIQKLYAKFRGLFGKQEVQLPDEERGLLRPLTENDDDPSSSATDSEPDSPMKPLISARRRSTAKGYGTLPSRMGTQQTPLSQLFLPPVDTASSVSTSSRLLICTLSLVSSALLSVLVSILEATGRKKQHREVEAGTVVGIIASMLFALLGLTSVLTARESVGLFNWIWIGVSFSIIGVMDGVLFGWALV